MINCCNTENNPEIAFIQGDSSPIVSVTIFDTAGAQITNLTGYTGVISIVQNLGGATIVFNEMDVVSSAFQGQFTPDQTDALAVGSYVTIVEIENEDLEFRREIQYSTVVSQQGYRA